jgi:uncharacterized protein (DUF1501 family)
MRHSNCNCNLNVITRRDFLSRSAKTSLAVALSTLVDIPLVMKQALAEGNIGLNGKKVLFVWLRGANDGLNSVIPILDPSYATSRPTLRIPTDPGTNYSTAGPADFPTAGSAGSTYGSYPYAIRLGTGFAAVHPSLKFLAPVYNGSGGEGDLALIHRVAYPRQSRSHFDSQRYWENGTPNNNIVSEGIFYRTMLEYLNDQGANASPLTGVSIQSSLPLILRGSDAPMTNLTDPLRYDLLGIPNDTNGNFKASMFLNQANTYPFPPKNSRGLLQLQYENMVTTLGQFEVLRPSFEETGNTFRDDVVTDDDQEWYDANGSQGYYLFPTTNVKNGGWRRPDGSNAGNKYAVPPGLQGLFNQIKAAAIILNKTDAIIAGTEYGGFDTHSQQGGVASNNANSHPELNKGFGWAMYALRKYFKIYGRNGTSPTPGAKASWDDVVVVTLTEFGRTTIENADLGTDHAEAGAMFVAGGAVNGYNAALSRSGVYNCSPSDPIPWVTGGSGSMFGVQGRYLRRTTDYRQVLGEIIRKHLGATQNQLNRIIPGYADPAERLLAGGTSVDGTPIRGELGIV